MASRIPAWKGNLLNLAGRATLTAVTLSAIPTHISIAVCLSPWAVGQIDKRRRAFLLTGRDHVAGGQCRVAWPIVCRPKELGGLGLIDLRRFGVALQLRWEWHRKLQSNQPWVALPLAGNKVVLLAFEATMDVILEDGRSVVFWLDRWMPDGCSVRDVALSLLNNMGRRHLGRTVANAINGHAWVQDIAEPYTVPVLLDYLRLWSIVRNVQLTANSPDVLRWRWSASMSYSSSSAYRTLFVGASRPLGAKELWKVSAPAKVKHFFWLALPKKC